MSRGANLGSGYVEVYPNLEGFAGELIRALDNVVRHIEGEGRHIGAGLAEGIHESITQSGAPEVQVDGDTSPILSALSGVQDGFQRLGDIGYGAIGTVADAVTDVLGSAVSAVGGTLKQSLESSISLGLGAAGAAGGAVLAQAVGGGLNRAISTNQAEASLRALGYEGERLAAVMESAEAGVEGTQYLISDAAAASGAFLANGVEAGEELEQVLQNVSNVAAQSGSNFDEIAPIMQRVASTGRLMGNEINMLEQRNIPIVSALAEEFGVAEEAVRDMASAGEIGFSDLNNALANSDLIANAETIASFDIGAAFANVRSALGRTTQPVFDAIIGGYNEVEGETYGLVRTFNLIRDALNDLMGDDWAGSLEPVISRITSAMEDLNDFIENMDLSRVIDMFDNLGSALIPIAGIIAGSAGGLASRIPVIGSAFAGLSGPVGLVISMFAGAVYYSERLQSAFGNLFGAIGDAASNAFNAIMGSDGDGFADMFELIGDRLAVAVDRIADAITWLEPYITDFFTGISSDGAFSGIVEMFSGAVEAVASFIQTLLSVLSSEGVATAFASLVDNIAHTFGGLFETIGGLVQGGGGTANLLETAIVGIITGLDYFVTGLRIIMGVISDIVNSTVFQTLFNWISTLVSTIAQNETAMIAIGTTLATVFTAMMIGPLVARAIGVVRMMMGIITPLMAFLRGGSAVAAAATTGGAARLGTAMAGLMSSITAGLSAVTAALPVVLKGIASVGLITAAIVTVIGLVGQLLSIDFIRDGISNVINLIVEIVSQFAPVMELMHEILRHMIDTIGEIISTIGSIIAENLPQILSALLVGLAVLISETLGALGGFAVDLATLISALFDGVIGVINGFANVLDVALSGITGIIDSISGFIQTIFDGWIGIMETFTDSLVTLMVNLSAHGFEAAGAATALAGALVALAAAMAGGGLGTSAAGVGEAALDGLANGIRNVSGTSNDSDTSGFINQVIALGEALQGVDSIVQRLPTIWSQAEALALVSGSNIMENFRQGIVLGNPQVVSEVRSSILSAINQAQMVADANPINLRVNVDTPNLNSLGSSVANSNVPVANRRGTTNNNTFNVSNPDPNVASRYIARQVGRR